jgi:hypothetical protein
MSVLRFRCTSPPMNDEGFLSDEGFLRHILEGIVL